MDKRTRTLVYYKFDGHCAYCGCELEMKDMQIDHIVPKCRGEERWVETIGTDDIENLNPSCRMCNYYKRMNDLETFRDNLSDMLMRNVRRPFDYRLALKYGLIKEDVQRVKFYFEKV
ncbi:MAG: HNH endonuclease, partial [Candidatus Cryptobacteroides sp.]